MGQAVGGKKVNPPPPLHKHGFVSAWGRRLTSLWFMTLPVLAQRGRVTDDGSKSKQDT